MSKEEFRTLKGYQLRDHNLLTQAMEDYLEMIYRAVRKDGHVRVKHLAAALNVRPSSASKMVQNLKELGYVDYEKYGIVRLTELGLTQGAYLLSRHELLYRFLRLVNHSDDVLEEVERLEHFFSPETVENLRRFLDRWEERNGE